MMSSRRLGVIAVVAAAILWWPRPACAQAGAPAAGAEQSAALAPLQAGFQDGFFIQTANGDTRLDFGMVAQTDGRFSLDDPPQTINTFTIRKVRPTLTGKIAKYFAFKVDPDFGNGTVVLEDAYFDISFSQEFRVRTGKDKTPVGYELEIGDAYVLFPERSLASSLVPNRDVGVQVLGDLAANRIHYDAGVFNGVPDGSNSTTELDANSSKDLAGRIVLTPFRSTQSPDRPINGLGFQVGGSTGREVGALPTFRTSVQQTYFSYASGAAASGTRSRVTPAVFYYHKAFGGYAEYMRSAQPVTRNGVETDVANHAWEATASYMLTGEAASEGIVRPKDDFDPANGRWGALQLVARYTTLTVDRSAFIAGLARAGSSRETRSFTLGANWYPNAYIKLYGTFERTMFNTDVTDGRPAENVILFRTQLAF
jgi:phosphate-selective porin OprO/OprP